VLESKAVEHKYTLMIGRTHGVHAEPTTFGLKLALWTQEMKRNAQRLAEAKGIVSVGKISGAVGTHATVPLEAEERACRELGLVSVPISSQIIQRDRHAQFVTTLAIIAGSLEKFATEIRSERICGLARLMRGYALTAMENIALWHERDISHSSAERVLLPDSCLLMDYALTMFTLVMKGLRVYPENMRRNLDLTRGLVSSQRVLLALIDKGMGREDAYKIVQDNAMKAWEERKNLLSLLETDDRTLAHLSKAELESLFDHSYYLRHVDDIFDRIGLGGRKADSEPGEETRFAQGGLAPHSI
jgi:adenylosuccinate lyase